MWMVLVPIVVGFAIAAQSSLLATRAAGTSPAAMSLSLMIAGVAVATIWATWTRRWPEVTDIARQWWWMPLGVAGWLIVAALGWSANRLGVATALALVIAAQLTGGLILDALAGRATLSPTSVVGAALIIGGALVLQLR